MAVRASGVACGGVALPRALGKGSDGVTVAGLDERKRASALAKIVLFAFNLDARVSAHKGGGWAVVVKGDREVSEVPVGVWARLQMTANVVAAI